MFEIANHRLLETDLPIITENYRELLVDELPILFTGSNRFASHIVGSGVEEDYGQQLERYFHVIIEEADYVRFLKQQVPYLDLLANARPLFIIDKTIGENRYKVYQSSLNQIPTEYWPSPDSVCPRAVHQPSYRFTASLVGGLANAHQAIPKEVSAAQNSLADVLSNAFATIKSFFDIDGQVVLGTSYSPGSFDINYEVQLRNVPLLFQQDEEYLHYLNEFLEYCFDNLVADSPQLALFEFDRLERFNRLVGRVLELSGSARRRVTESEVKDSLVRDLAKTAQSLKSAAKSVGKSFNGIAVKNGPPNNYLALGMIDKSFLGGIERATTVLEVMRPGLEAEHEEAREYTIHVFDFNKNTGAGWAYVGEPGEESKQFTAAISIKDYEPISPSIYTHSLDQNEFVQVKGIIKKRGKGGRILAIES